MPQEVVLQSNLSILEETLTTFTQLHTLQQEALHLEQLLVINPDTTTLDRYALVQEQLAGFAPEQLAAQTKKMLMGLGFSTQQLDQPVSNLSVGWKMRIVLAKLLLQDADFYLFDEPTNHLDLMAKEWFLQFLKESSFGFMLICHERYFLDELCDKILELELGKATWYTGNYSHYLVQKEHAIELLKAAKIQQEKELKRKWETVERFRASASKAKMAQSMIKALEKIEIITLPPSPKNVSFSFPPVQQSGKLVVSAQNVAHAFEAKTLFSDVSFEIERGQKIAIIAPNGVGKTTLFNLITGALPLQQGKITFGHNVSHAIFAQDQNKVLNLQETILDNIKRLCPKASEQTIRSFLGAFLFSSDDILKKVKVLSGGEKNRVGMVSVLLQNSNLLLLDEPTNHLDIPSKEILLRALQEFKGTIIFVSHDRDFINALATHVIELTPQGAHPYHGNYDSYVQHKAFLPTTDAQKQSMTSETKESEAHNDIKKQPFELVKKGKKLEDRIAKIEQQIQQIQESFADLDYGTPAFKAAQDKLENLQDDLKKTELEWEMLQKELYT
jgi:ATP-binding cassette subfamily F protein 3